MLAVKHLLCTIITATASCLLSSGALPAGLRVVKLSDHVCFVHSLMCQILNHGGIGCFPHGDSVSLANDCLS